MRVLALPVLARPRPDPPAAPGPSRPLLSCAQHVSPRRPNLADASVRLRAWPLAACRCSVLLSYPSACTVSDTTPAAPVLNTPRNTSPVFAVALLPNRCSSKRSCPSSTLAAMSKTPWHRCLTTPLQRTPERTRPRLPHRDARLPHATLQCPPWLPRHRSAYSGKPTANLSNPQRDSKESSRITPRLPLLSYPRLDQTIPAWARRPRLCYAIPNKHRLATAGQGCLAKKGLDWRCPYTTHQIAPLRGCPTQPVRSAARIACPLPDQTCRPRRSLHSQVPAFSGSAQLPWCAQPLPTVLLRNGARQPQRKNPPRAE